MDFDATQAVDFDCTQAIDDFPEEGSKQNVGKLVVAEQKGFPFTEFVLQNGEKYVIGRNVKADIQIPLKGLSKEHCCIEVKDGVTLIWDMESRNKTRRNKMVLSPNVRYELQNNNKLVFGDVNATFLEIKEATDDGSDTDSDLSEILDATQGFHTNNKSSTQTPTTALNKPPLILETPAVQLAKKESSEYVLAADSDSEEPIVDQTLIMYDDTDAIPATQAYEEDDCEPNKSGLFEATQPYSRHAAVDDSDEEANSSESDIFDNPDSIQNDSKTFEATQAYGRTPQKVDPIDSTQILDDSFENIPQTRKSEQPDETQYELDENETQAFDNSTNFKMPKLPGQKNEKESEQTQYVLAEDATQIMDGGVESPIYKSTPFISTKSDTQYELADDATQAMNSGPAPPVSKLNPTIKQTSESDEQNNAAEDDANAPTLMVEDLDVFKMPTPVRNSRTKPKISIIPPVVEATTEIADIEETQAYEDDGPTQPFDEEVNTTELENVTTKEDDKNGATDEHKMAAAHSDSNSLDDDATQAFEDDREIKNHDEPKENNVKNDNDNEEDDLDETQGFDESDFPNAPMFIPNGSPSKKSTPKGDETNEDASDSVNDANAPTLAISEVLNEKATPEIEDSDEESSDDESLLLPQVNSDIPTVISDKTENSDSKEKDQDHIGINEESKDEEGDTQPIVDLDIHQTTKAATANDLDEDGETQPIEEELVPATVNSTAEDKEEINNLTNIDSNELNEDDETQPIDEDTVTVAKEIITEEAKDETQPINEPTTSTTDSTQLIETQLMDEISDIPQVKISPYNDAITPAKQTEGPRRSGRERKSTNLSDFLQPEKPVRKSNRKSKSPEPAETISPPTTEELQATQAYGSDSPVKQPVKPNKRGDKDDNVNAAKDTSSRQTLGNKITKLSKVEPVELSPVKVQTPNKNLAETQAYGDFDDATQAYGASPIKAPLIPDINTSPSTTRRSHVFGKMNLTETPTKNAIEEKELVPVGDKNTRASKSKLGQNETRVETKPKEIAEEAPLSKRKSTRGRQFIKKEDKESSHEETAEVLANVPNEKGARNSKITLGDANKVTKKPPKPQTKSKTTTNSKNDSVPSEVKDTEVPVRKSKRTTGIPSKVDMGRDDTVDTDDTESVSSEASEPRRSGRARKSVIPVEESGKKGTRGSKRNRSADSVSVTSETSEPSKRSRRLTEIKPVSKDEPKRSSSRGKKTEVEDDKPAETLSTTRGSRSKKIKIEDDESVEKITSTTRGARTNKKTDIENEKLVETTKGSRSKKAKVEDESNEEFTCMTRGSRSTKTENKDDEPIDTTSKTTRGSRSKKIKVEDDEPVKEITSTTKGSKSKITEVENDKSVGTTSTTTRGTRSKKIKVEEEPNENTTSSTRGSRSKKAAEDSKTKKLGTSSKTCRVNKDIDDEENISSFSNTSENNNETKVESIVISKSTRGKRGAQKELSEEVQVKKGKKDGIKLEAQVKLEAPKARSSRGRKSEMPPPAPAATGKVKRQRSADSISSSQKSDPGSPARLSRPPVNISSPSLRAPSIKPRILFTGVVDDQGQKTLKSLGGEHVQTVADCTHLVTDKVRRTVKFLCCIARGIPIVSTVWLERCKDAKTFLDATPFIIRDQENEKKFSFSMETSLKKATQRQLFEGYQIHATKSVKPDASQIKEIVESAGGKYLSSPMKKPGNKYVVIATEDDHKLCQPMIDMGVTVVSNEFILTGVLQQELNMQTYRLFTSSKRKR